MDCPRCGATTDGASECPRCGVILAKARPQAPRPGAARLPCSPPVRAGGRGLGWTLLALAVLALAALGVLLRRPRPAPSVVATAQGASEPGAAVDSVAPPAALEGVALPELTLAPAPAPELSAIAQAVEERDRVAAERLGERLRSLAPLGDGDLRVAEDLHTRYPAASVLLEAVLLRLAQQSRARREYADALALLQRVLGLAPQSNAAQRLLLGVHLEQADWPGAETAARALLQVTPGDGESVRALAYALVRQDRGREAIEALAGYLEGRSDPAAQALYDRLRNDHSVEAPLGRQNLSHFHVRYDGAAHEEAGRLVLRVLERHYATLVTTFGHQPGAAIPVILLSQQSYYDATGAPIWAGGHYDNFDGRVRIPIAGIDGASASDLDETVLHELTHAFVADRSAGLAPRELHEGLAQLVQGRRSATLLGDDGLRALADGRIGGVNGFYLAALVFVEDLIAQRGQGGINDVLAAMARTRDVDQAFRQVYGSDWRSLASSWSTRLRSRYGS